MPRKIDPATIIVGHGLAASDSVEVNAFIPGSGEPGAPAAGGGGAGMVQHIIDEHDAHPASSVSVDDVPKIYDASNVEGVLDELAALVPPRPPTVGHSLHYFKTTSIPDWGILKLDDATWFLRSQHLFPTDQSTCWFDYEITGLDGVQVPNPDTGLEVYPYFWRTPRGAAEFRTKGNDPYTDPMFNVGDASYSGGGVGVAHAGAFTRSNHRTLSMTHEIIPSSGPEGGKEVVVSGVVFPADRGTLALIRFEPNGEFAHLHHPEDFKLRVLAALNLGQGILDKCDGHPGGIFWLGDHGGDCAPHSYDPFTFPGRATGQYNLWEIHAGKDLHGNDLLNEFYDFDGDGGQGSPASGQVRLGTDPNSGIEIIPDGIPILGGTTIARGGGNDGNFFRYRLPYLTDYSKPHGLPWTPPEEHYRFYEKPPVALDPGNDLEHAGDFRSFAKNYWTYQVARYRQQFLLPTDTLLEYDPRDCGHYVLIHFKKEAYFEEMVRDLMMPTQDKIYSSNLIDWGHLGSVWNKVRSSTQPVHSSCYHVLRSNVYEDVLGDKDSEFCEHPVPQIVDGKGQHEVATVNWNIENTMFVSGIQYAVSSAYELGWETGLAAKDLVVLLKAPDHTVSPPVYGLFETSFLTHDGKDGYGESAITGDALYMGNMFPAFLGTSAFTPVADTTHATVGGAESAEPFTHPENFRRGRIQFGTGHLLSDDGDFPVPVENTVAQMLLSSDEDDPALRFDGDTLPKFSQDASLRAFFRRPLNHGREITDHSHFFDVGIRLHNAGDGLKDATLLWHGSDHSKDRPYPVKYSNMVDIWMSTMADPATHEDLWHESKDPKERFLDETYRFRSDFKALNGSLPLGLKITETLCGPGLPHGTKTDLHVPVRLEDIDSTDWVHIHWLTSKSHHVPLSESEQRLELQVAGWPDRNFSIKAGVTDPTPTSGILIYPQHDYTANCLPLQNAACDYSVLSGKDVGDALGGRSWVRAFSLGHQAAGASLIDLDLRGLQLDDFEWSPPDPGSRMMAVLIKVPGLTTWMDCGRRDGEGPSKQDPFADGAGCMVMGPGTKDLNPLPKMGINRCTVRCNLGPSAQLFDGRKGAVVLVKVVFYPKHGVDANFEQNGPTGYPQELMGLCGLRISEGE